MRITTNDNSVFIPDGPVSSRIFLPVLARSIESQKKNSLLTDHKAVEIHQQISDADTLFKAAKEDLIYYAIINRTLCFDRLIRDFIWRYPSGIIINIGCGLETTYERMKASSVRWYDVDLPEVIKVRKMFFTETETRKFICSSFLKNEWLDQIVSGDSVLVYAGGVFYYYNENAIRKFFARLTFWFPSFEIVFDVTTPAGVRAANRLILKNGMTDGPFLKWGLADYKTLLEWNSRIRLIGRYRIFNKGLKLPLGFYIPAFISDVLSLENVIHLKIRYDYRKM